jgi:hypothetical protein
MNERLIRRALRKDLRLPALGQFGKERLGYA